MHVGEHFKEILLPLLLLGQTLNPNGSLQISLLLGLLDVVASLAFELTWPGALNDHDSDIEEEVEHEDVDVDPSDFVARLGLPHIFIVEVQQVAGCKHRHLIQDLLPVHVRLPVWSLRVRVAQHNQSEVNLNRYLQKEILWEEDDGGHEHVSTHEEEQIVLNSEPVSKSFVSKERLQVLNFLSVTFNLRLVDLVTDNEHVDWGSE